MAGGDVVHPLIAPMIGRLASTLDGYAHSLVEGLRIESGASRAHARQLTPEALAARRAGVQARGRQQGN